MFASAILSTLSTLGKYFACMRCCTRGDRVWVQECVNVTPLCLWSNALNYVCKFWEVLQASLFSVAKPLNLRSFCLILGTPLRVQTSFVHGLLFQRRLSYGQKCQCTHSNLSSHSRVFALLNEPASSCMGHNKRVTNGKT